MEDHLFELHVLYLNNMFDPKIVILDLYSIIEKFNLKEKINEIVLYPVLTTTLLNSGIIRQSVIHFGWERVC
jgi:hypothetical protein